MSRVRLLMSATTDLDADAHVRRLVARDGAEVDDVVTREWPLIARAALRLRRRRADSDDVLVTVGEAALLAASLGWRGRQVHMPVGTATASECFALRRRPAIRVVVSSASAVDRLMAGGVSSPRVRTVAPPHVEEPPTRAEARQRLRIGNEGITVVAPGTIRPGSGHRLAIWACALLAYRDRSWRFLVGRRGDDERATSLIESTREPATDPFIRYRDGDEPNALSAADIAVFAGDGVPERSMLDAALQAGLSIVAPRALIARESLSPANVFTYPSQHPRLIARAILVASDALAAARAPAPPRSDGTSWDESLAF